MNGKIIGTKPLYVALAQRKDVRRQALETQIAQRNSQRVQMPGVYGFPMAYPPMPGYAQPGMPQMRPMYNPMQARPRYPQQPGMPGMMPAYGMPPQMSGYPGVTPPNYPGPRSGVRPPMAAPNAGLRNGGPSPVGMPSGLPQGVPRGSMPAVRPPIMDQGIIPQQPPRLNAQSLARAAPSDQKQMLGEALYPLIHE